MHFTILCFDQPHVGELREKTRPAHLEYLKRHHELVHLGGPIENEDGGIAPSSLSMLPIARQLLLLRRKSPSIKRGVFESVIVRRSRQMQPEVVSGANGSSATEGSNQLKEERQS